MFSGRRRMFCTVGVPLGCESAKVTLSCATALATGAVIAPKYPPLTGGESVRFVDAVVLMVSVPAALETGVPVAAGVGEGVGVEPPPPPPGVIELPPPPPQATSASATEKSKGRPTKRAITRIALVS